MAMKVRYTVVDGEVLSELRGGVKRDYVPDPLGSTVALLDSTQVITDTFSYWPYGESAGRTGTTATPFQYVGGFGYYNDNGNRSYVRARFLDKGKGQWTTEDPIGIELTGVCLYRYAYSNPETFVDYLGLKPPQTFPPQKFGPPPLTPPIFFWPPLPIPAKPCPKPQMDCKSQYEDCRFFIGVKAAGCYGICAAASAVCIAGCTGNPEPITKILCYRYCGTLAVACFGACLHLVDEWRKGCMDEYQECLKKQGS
jgi:RHS repeat-associated protein